MDVDFHCFFKFHALLIKIILFDIKSVLNFLLNIPPPPLWAGKERTVRLYDLVPACLGAQFSSYLALLLNNKRKKIGKLWDSLQWPYIYIELYIMGRLWMHWDDLITEMFHVVDALGGSFQKDLFQVVVESWMHYEDFSRIIWSLTCFRWLWLHWDDFSRMIWLHYKDC